MPTLTNEMMRAIIMDHYSNPTNKRAPARENYSKIHMHSDNCIDDLDIFMLIDSDKVIDVCFDGVGCAISTASTDIMCNLLQGKTTKEALYIIEQYNHMIHEEEFDDSVLDEALAFINTSKQAARIGCATVGWRAADTLLKDK